MTPGTRSSATWSRRTWQARRSVQPRFGACRLVACAACSMDLRSSPTACTYGPKASAITSATTQYDFRAACSTMFANIRTISSSTTGGRFDPSGGRRSRRVHGGCPRCSKGIGPLAQAIRPVAPSVLDAATRAHTGQGAAGSGSKSNRSHRSRSPRYRSVMVANRAPGQLSGPHTYLMRTRSGASAPHRAADRRS